MESVRNMKKRKQKKHVTCPLVRCDCSALKRAMHEWTPHLARYAAIQKWHTIYASDV